MIRQLAGVSINNALAPLALRHRFSAALPLTDIDNRIMTPFYAKVKHFTCCKNNYNVLLTIVCCAQYNIEGGDILGKREELVNSMIMELRRGAVVIGVLSQLTEPQYGYSLVQVLEEKGFSVEPGTLYPLLRRLEKQGLLESSWDTNESRPRKYYHLSPEGLIIYEALCNEWRNMTGRMADMIDY